MPELFQLFTIVSITFYFSVLIFLLTGFLRIKNPKTNRQPTVSVVVAARNEEKKIKNCLTCLISQIYPRELTDLIIVDDRSSDNTPKILKQFNAQYKNINMLRISETPQGISPKKFALGKGISQAKGELIFTTDADCMPPPDWLSQTVHLFHKNVGLIIGPAPFIEEKNLWNKLLCLDNFATAFVSAGTTGWGVAVTCTGRNLAYRKCVFNDVNGFHKINHSLSGDDDLFLQTVKKHSKWKITYSMNPKSAITSSPAKNFSAYIAQRRRHVSASKYYSGFIQAAYFLFNLANLVLFGFFILSWFLSEYFLIWALLFSVKLAIDFLCLYLITKKFERQHLLYFFPLWEIFNLLNQTIISPLGFVGKAKWKE